MYDSIVCLPGFHIVLQYAHGVNDVPPHGVDRNMWAVLRGVISRNVVQIRLGMMLDEKIQEHHPTIILLYRFHYVVLQHQLWVYRCRGGARRLFHVRMYELWPTVVTWGWSLQILQNGLDLQSRTRNLGRSLLPCLKRSMTYAPPSSGLALFSPSQ